MAASPALQQYLTGLGLSQDQISGLLAAAGGTDGTVNENDVRVAAARYAAALASGSLATGTPPPAPPPGTTTPPPSTTGMQAAVGIPQQYQGLSSAQKAAETLDPNNPADVQWFMQYSAANGATGHYEGNNWVWDKPPMTLTEARDFMLAQQAHVASRADTVAARTAPGVRLIHDAQGNAHWIDAQGNEVGQSQVADAQGNWTTPATTHYLGTEATAFAGGSGAVVDYAAEAAKLKAAAATDEAYAVKLEKAGDVAGAAKYRARAADYLARAGVPSTPLGAGSVPPAPPPAAAGGGAAASAGGSTTAGGAPPTAASGKTGNPLAGKPGAGDGTASPLPSGTPTPSVPPAPSGLAPTGTVPVYINGVRYNQSIDGKTLTPA